MRTENPFEISKETTEITAIHKSLAQNLVANFNSKTNRDLFIEIDCVPNVGLNAFHIGNGVNSAKMIIDVNKALSNQNEDWLERKIAIVENETWNPSYILGENIGLWKRVKENNYEELIDWSRPFCVKNAKGLTKIWHPRSRKIYKTGFATRSSIVRFIKEETAYLLPFYNPIPVPNNRLGHSIYRLIFFSNGKDEPEFIGGLVITRQGFKIYPGPGSIVGLIKVKNKD